jgi:hypothetical protein
MNKLSIVEWSAKALDIRVLFCTKEELGFTNIGYHVILENNPSIETMEQNLLIADKQGHYQIIFYCNDYGDDVELEEVNNVVSLADFRFKKLTKRTDK